MSRLHRIGRASGLRLLPALLVVCFGATASLSAQDPKALFDAGMQDLWSGNKDAAIAKFRELARLDPENPDVQRLVIESQDALLDLMMEGGEFETFAKHLLSSMGDPSTEAIRDADAAAQLAEKALSGTYAERAQARFELVTRHGPFGAVPLVRALAEPNEDRRLAAIYALSRMGTEMTVPLLIATSSADRNVRMGVVQALGNLGDARAHARLAGMAANDEDGAIRAMAASFVPGGDLATMHYDQGAAYWSGDPLLGLNAADNYGVLWSIEGATLQPYDVPRAIAPLEMAKWHFSRARELGHPSAGVGLALVYGAELAILEGMGDAGQAAHAVQTRAALSLPQGDLDTGLQEALANGHYHAAESLIGLLDGPGLAHTGGLEQALNAAVPNVRHAAALTLARAGQGHDGVISNLADALGLEAVRVVHIMDADAGRRSELAAALAAQGVMVVEAEDGAGGLVNSYRALFVDAFVMADPLPDLYARVVTRRLRANDRYSDTPVIVLGNDQTGDVEGADVVDAVSAESVVAAFGDLGLAREKHAATSRAAAEALGHLAQSNASGVAAHADRIAAAINREDEVAVPALHALGRSGSVSHLNDLVAIVGDDSRSNAARGAAADGIASILAQAPGTPVDTTALAAGAASDDTTFAQACARALGLAGSGYAPAWVMVEG